jgi:hypothetical protein
LYSPKTWLESFFSISSSHCCTTGALMPESSMAAALRSRASTRPDETGRPAVGGGAGPRRGDPGTPPAGADADVANDVAAGVADVAGETSMLTSAAAPAGTGRALLGGKLSEGRRSMLGGTGTAGSGAAPTTDGRRSSAMRGCGCGCGSGFRAGVLGDDVGEPASVCDHCFVTPAADDDEPVAADADTDDDNADDDDDDDDDDDEDVEVAGVAAAKEGDEKKAPNLALSEEGAGAAVVVAALGAGSFSHERR